MITYVEENRRLGPIIIVISVCLALVIGLVFVVPAIRSPKSTNYDIKFSVTGKPPGVNGPWSLGYRTGWAITMPVTDPLFSIRMEGQTNDRALVFTYSGETSTGVESGSFSVIDTSTGTTLWTNESFGYWLPRFVGDEVHSELFTDGNSVTHRYDSTTGDLIGTLDAADMGIPIPHGQALQNLYFGIKDMCGMMFTSYLDLSADPYGFIFARLKDDSSGLMWKTRVSIFYQLMPSTPRLHHGVMTDGIHFAIDVATGDLLATCEDPNFKCGVEWLADNVLGGVAGGTSQTTFPDGTPGLLTDASAIRVTSGMLPPHPVRWAGGEIQAFDPWSEEVIWSTAADLDKSDDFQAAYDGHRVIVTDQTRHAIAFDPGTGEVLWQATLPREAVLNMPDFLDDGTLLIQQWVDESVTEEGHTLVALNPATGEFFWTVDGYLAQSNYYSYPMLGPVAGYDGLVITTSPDTIVRLMPKARPNSSPVPDDAPPCASGEPVSWVKYVDGSVLICVADSEYIVTSSIEAPATSLAFTADGYTVKHLDHQQVRVQYGSENVEITNGQDTIPSRVITNWAPWVL